jgi:hypothetical protein
MNIINVKHPDGRYAQIRESELPVWQGVGFASTGTVRVEIDAPQIIPVQITLGTESPGGVDVSGGFVEVKAPLSIDEFCKKYELNDDIFSALMKADILDTAALKKANIQDIRGLTKAKINTIMAALSKE